MKISPQTISLLKNFATINQSIVIKPGNVIAVQDAGPAIRAMATVAEKFPTTVSIYDLHQFLGTLAMMGDCDVEFGERSATFTVGKHSAEYFYDASAKEASQKRSKGGEFFSFALSERDITTILKAAAVFSAPMLSFVGLNGKAEIQVGSPKNDNFNSPHNTFRLDLGACEVEDFDLRIPVGIFKVVPRNYTVTLNKQKFIHLAAVEVSAGVTASSLEYWLAGDPESEV